MSALSPRQMFLLDLSCKPIREAFTDAGFGPFLVGSTTERRNYRDVDVRFMLNDDAYAALADTVGAAGIAFISLAIGQYLASLTGLPIDFQLQQATAANRLHDGVRNPLGLRHLSNFDGDAPAAPAPTRREVNH